MKKERNWKKRKESLFGLSLVTGRARNYTRLGPNIIQSKHVRLLDNKIYMLIQFCARSHACPKIKRKNVSCYFAGFCVSIGVAKV